LERDIGSGAIAEDDLNDAVVDIVLSNLATTAGFGADVIVSAVLLKLLSGIVKQLDVYFENRVISVPQDSHWKLGSVSVVSTVPFYSRLIDLGAHEDFGWTSDAKSFFHVQMSSTRSTLRDRARLLIRAFVSATRILANGSAPKSPISMPTLGALEPDSSEKETPLRYFAESDDGTITLSGDRIRFPYRLSSQILDDARKSRLFSILDDSLRLELFSPVSPELLALDRLTRARTSDDPLEQVHWNLEAVDVLLRPDENLEIRSLDHALSEVQPDAKKVKQFLQIQKTLDQLRHRTGFVSGKDAALAQFFAEEVVATLLLKASRPDYRR
jgi:hypothetical protein